MQKILLFGLLLILVNFSVKLLAASNETLPSYHWTYRVIEQLQDRGYCLDLLQMNKPYTRGEAAKSVLAAQTKIEQDKSMDSFYKDKLLKLVQEFESEIQILKNETGSRQSLLSRFYIQADGNKLDGENINYRGIYRGGVGAQVSHNIFAYAGVNFDQYDYYDSDYLGYKWRGVVGYEEQAYINITWDRLQFKLGRDFLEWGIGKSGSLLLSNTYRPFDQLFVSTNFGPFKFSFLAAELDQKTIRDKDLVYREYRRFLSGHRLDASFWGGRIQAAISEIIVYGQTNGGFNTVYLNPLIFYHGEKKNGAGDNNVLPAVDLLVYPLKNWKLYSSILIDDIQLEKTEPGDLEPNEIGIVFGTAYAEPFQISGLSLDLEYVRIANRTYKTSHPQEIYTHRNEPMGHPLGNDFDHWLLGCSYWLKNNLWLNLKYAHTRNGEGGLFTPWDQPWMNLTLEQGYSEPFPTGVIEQRDALELELSWYAKHWLRVYGQFSYDQLNNASHVQRQTSRQWHGRLRLEMNWDKLWLLTNK